MHEHWRKRVEYYRVQQNETWRSLLLKIETSLLAEKYRVISSSKNFPDPSLSLMISGWDLQQSALSASIFQDFPDKEQKKRTIFIEKYRLSSFSAPMAHQFLSHRGRKIPRSSRLLDLRMKLLLSWFLHDSWMTTRFCNELQFSQHWEHWLYCFLYVPHPFTR